MERPEIAGRERPARRKVGRQKGCVEEEDQNTRVVVESSRGERPRDSREGGSGAQVREAKSEGGS